MSKPVFKNSGNVSGSFSPERLDIPIEIKISKSWWVWGVVTACLLAVVIWSIFGKVNVRVDGPGIILPKSVTMFNATSEGNGLLLTVDCNLGDVVKKGQVLATVDVSEYKQKIKQTEQYLSKLKEEDKKIKIFANTQDKNLKDYAVKFDKALAERRDNSLKYKSFLDDFVAKEKHLKKIGAIAPLTYEKSVEALYGVENELLQIMSDKANNALELEENQFQWFKETNNITLEILKHEHLLASQNLHLKKIQSIKSPIDGVVTQIFLLPGSYASPGKTVATVASTNVKKEAIAFLPTSMGKRVGNEMNAFVSPTIAKKERYGTIPGKVWSVSEYPLDSSMLSSLLKDDDLAKLFSKSGPPIMCKLSLSFDENNISGFAWTSGEGPPFKITNGNICNISVVVERRRPITYVMPFLREWLGMEYE